MRRPPDSRPGGPAAADRAAAPDPAALRRPARRRWLRLVGLSVLLAACGSSDASAFRAELETVVSWGATVQMLATAWRAGAAPHTYVSHALRTADEELQASLKRLRALPRTAGVPGVAEPLQAMERAVARVRAAVRRDDRPAAEAAATEVSATLRALDALARSGRAS